MSFEIGDTIDAYRIVGVAGSGGMGKVFQVEHIVTRRLEAMKVVTGSRPDANEHAQRFLREIQLQASLTHPNITAVYNAFWTGNDLVLVMELVEGTSLQRVLESGRLPLETGIDYACQALRALSYAHSKGVVHRDISPANMIITAEGTVKLTDFGLAKATVNPRLTQTGVVMGSLHYTSPEQVKGLHTVDERSDIYSVGAVLYEIVTGKKPFETDNAFSLMVAHVEETPAPSVEINPDIPPRLNEIIQTTLAKDPALRFQRAGDFLDALEQLSPRSQPVTKMPAVGRSVAGQPASALPHVASRLPPFRWKIAAAVAIAVLAVLLAGIRIMRSSHSSGQPEPDKLALPAAQPVRLPEARVRPSPQHDSGTSVPRPPKRPSPTPKTPVRVEASRQATPPPVAAASSAQPADSPAGAEKPKKRRHWFWRTLSKIPHPHPSKQQDPVQREVVEDSPTAGGDHPEP